MAINLRLRSGDLLVEWRPARADRRPSILGRPPNDHGIGNAGLTASSDEQLLVATKRQ